MKRTDLTALERTPLTFYDVRDQLKRHVYARTEQALAAGDAARDRIASLADLAERQRYIREHTLRSVGGLPASAAELRPRTAGVVRCGGFRIERVMFDSRPNTTVTANLYVPENLDAPGGAVLFLCGHEAEGKQSYYRDTCRLFAKAGFVTLCIDFLGQGERLSYIDPATREPIVPPGTAEHMHAGLQCVPLGDSLAKYFLHDAMRGLDFLRSRPEVDPAKIGVTGNSGGGLVTALMMLCDPRIAAAAPGTFLMNRRTNLYAGKAQDAEQIWPGFTAYGLDHEDVLIAMAPRPVIVLAASYDFFPIEGTRETVARTRRFWEMAGHPDRLRLFEEAVGHRYTPRMAREAAGFFAAVLLGAPAAEGPPPAPAPLEPSLLQCTATGQVLGDDPNQRTAFDENQDRLAALSAARHADSPEARRQEANDWLRAQVFRHRRKGALNPRVLPVEWEVGALAATSILWRSQPDLWNHAYVFREAVRRGETLPVTLALWSHGTNRLAERTEWIEAECRAARAVMVLDAAGWGKLTPHPLFGGDPFQRFEIVHKLNDDLFWIGDSLAAIRVYDIIRALDVLAELPGIAAEGAALYAAGHGGFYGSLASRIEPRIERFVWEPPHFHPIEWMQSKLYDDEDTISLLLPGMLNALEWDSNAGNNDNLGK